MLVIWAAFTPLQNVFAIPDLESVFDESVKKYICQSPKLTVNLASVSFLGYVHGCCVLQWTGHPFRVFPWVRLRHHSDLT